MPGRPISRRSALVALGVAAGAGATATAGGRAGWFSGESAAAPAASVSGWARDRGRHYYLAHRGSGDVLPEHSVPAYRAARTWGARAMEVSVAVTADGVLVCMHDLTYDRTTNTKGRISSLPSSVLDSVRIVQPQLGPAWTASPPPVPRLDDVLTEFGGKLVLCLEAKDDAAYPAMMSMVERRGLRDSVVVKSFSGSKRIEQAQRAGYPVFAYAGAADATAEGLAALAGRLRHEHDYLGLPSTGQDGNYLPDDVVRQAVGHGLPVWVYPIHRRSEAAHYFGLGVSGAVCSSYGYLSGSLPPLTHDTWASRSVASGEMTRHPEQPSLSPAWTGKDELTLARRGAQFLTLGQVSPVRNAETSYRVEVQARWKRLPSEPTARLSLAFGHSDDSYYEPGLGQSTGYEAFLQADGGLALRAHSAGSASEVVLADAATPPPVQGQWVSLRLSVTPSTLTLSRTDLDAAVATARDFRTRGGYLHLGRASGKPSVAAFRDLRVL